MAHYRYGGRQKGTKNKTTPEVQEFVDAIFKRVNPEQLACKLLESKDVKVKALMLLKLLEYRYGQPTKRLEVAGEVTHKHVRTIEEVRGRIIELERERGTGISGITRVGSGTTEEEQDSRLLPRDGTTG